VHHDVLVFLLSLAVLLGMARAFGAVAHKLGMPAVVGEILAGVFIGKTVLGRVAPGAFNWLFSDGTPRVLISGYTSIAAVLLLVVAGIEIDLTVVRRSSRTVIFTSVLGAVVPFILGYSLGLILPDSALQNPARREVHAAFLGIALSISALPVIARTLLDLGLMKTDLGLIIVSAAVFNDLVGWICFTVLSREFVVAGSTDLAHIAISVGLTVAFVVATLLIVRPLVDRVLAHMEQRREDVSGSVLSMVMVLALLGASATEALGMHPVFGGFVMGLAVGDSKRLREHTRSILTEFVTNVFTPVFFATMALRVDFAAAFDLKLTLVVLAIACAAKIVGCAVGARFGGIGWRESFAIGFGMNSRGAMEILLALLALEANIINQKIFVALIIMAIATSLISGPALVRLLRPTPSPVVELLRAGVLELDLESRSRTAAITTLATAIAERIGSPGDAERFAQAVLAREEIAGTGVGDGVAFPHAEIRDLPGPAMALARLKRGLDFDAPDGEPVRLVLMLLMPPREFERELRLLSGMARLLAREEVRRGLLDAADTKAALATLEEADRATATPSSNRGASEGAAPAKG
jgi:Kef-type K+ transport system membrane component KefB